MLDECRVADLQVFPHFQSLDTVRDVAKSNQISTCFSWQFVQMCFIGSFRSVAVTRSWLSTSGQKP
jgi:hypothetical protein